MTISQVEFYFCSEPTITIPYVDETTNFKSTLNVFADQQLHLAFGMNVLGFDSTERQNIANVLPKTIAVSSPHSNGTLTITFNQDKKYNVEPFAIVDIIDTTHNITRKTLPYQTSPLSTFVDALGWDSLHLDLILNVIAVAQPTSETFNYTQTSPSDLDMLLASPVPTSLEITPALLLTPPNFTPIIIIGGLLALGALFLIGGVKN